MYNCLFLRLPANNSSTTPLLFPASIPGKRSQPGRLPTTTNNALHYTQIMTKQTQFLTWFGRLPTSTKFTLTGWLSLSSSLFIILFTREFWSHWSHSFASQNWGLLYETTTSMQFLNKHKNLILFLSLTICQTPSGCFLVDLAYPCKSSFINQSNVLN